MPSTRKRIGFLPRADVQEIIDKICKINKLSQSKVTGILVEEALSVRGILNRTLDKKFNRLDCYNINSSLTNNNNSNNNLDNEIDNPNLDESYLNDEIQMIHDFIEFKLFKNVMTKNKIGR